MIIKYLLEKEFKLFFRNSFFPKLSVGLPVAALVVFPFVTTMDVKKVSISVVDNDNSVLSGQLISQADFSEYFTVNNVTNNYNFAVEDVESGKSDVVLEIPENFSENIINHKPTDLQISVDAVNGMKGSIGAGYLNGFVNKFAATTLINKGFNTAQPLNIVVRNSYNPCLDYKLFMVPALIVVVLIMLCGLLPALNIVSEKENGTMEQINVTPIKNYQFILSKLIPYWLVGLAAVTLDFLIARFMYNIIPVGSFATIYAAALLFLLCMSGLGLVISNYSDTMQQALFVMYFFLLVFMLMSGLFTSVYSMPKWTQYLTLINPPHYFIDIMRGIFIKGAGFAENVANFLCLSLLAVILVTWAVLSYKKRS